MSRVTAPETFGVELWEAKEYSLLRIFQNGVLKGI